MWIFGRHNGLVVGCAIVIGIGAFSQPARGTRLRPATAAAFDDYVRASEARMDQDLRENRFFVIDSLPDAKRSQAYSDIRGGKLYVQSLHATQDGQPIAVPAGLVYDWVGIVFIPGVKLPQVMSLLQDYDRQKYVYKPDIRDSRLLGRDGNNAKVYMQFYSKTIITVVLNGTFNASYMFVSSTRAVGMSYSTRIAEVQNPGKPNEHELPVGNDHGYLWRLRSYWRLAEADGGVYVQVESLGLSRGIPAAFAWIRPLLQMIPEGYLSRVLKSTRNAVEDPKSYQRSAPSVAAD